MSNARDTILEVQGMTCPSCIRHIDQALTDVEGVDRVEVKLRDGLVVVRHDGLATSVEQLIEALRDAGYDSQPRRS